jgi:hypothetical protein
MSGSERRPVLGAGEIARNLAEEDGGLVLPISRLTRLVRRFSAIEFEVPDLPDADGYLFQYGQVNWFSEPTFALGVVRQFELVDAHGEHDSYVQVQFEFRYPLDGELESAGNYSEWWFPGDGVPLDRWLESVDRAPIMGVLSAKMSRNFEIWQEMV